jgi:hypothetical protein
MYKKSHFLYKPHWLCIAISLFLCSCSIVQFLPSSSCERVTYDRVGSKVTVLAECTL